MPGPTQLTRRVRSFQRAGSLPPASVANLPAENSLPHRVNFAPACYYVVRLVDLVDEENDSTLKDFDITDVFEFDVEVTPKCYAIIDDVTVVK